MKWSTLYNCFNLTINEVDNMDLDIRRSSLILIAVIDSNHSTPVHFFYSSKLWCQLKFDMGRCRTNTAAKPTIIESNILSQISQIFELLHDLLRILLYYFFVCIQGYFQVKQNCIILIDSCKIGDLSHFDFRAQSLFFLQVSSEPLTHTSIKSPRSFLA